jgi:cyclin C
MTSASEFVDDLTSMSLRDEVLTFLAGINVSLETIASIAQEIMSTYSLWDSITDGTEADALSRIDRREARGATRRDIPEKKLITEKEIVAIATKMREDRERDQAHPATGRPLPVNKRLERAMGA